MFLILGGWKRRLNWRHNKRSDRWAWQYLWYNVSEWTEFGKKNVICM